MIHRPALHLSLWDFYYALNLPCS